MHRFILIFSYLIATFIFGETEAFQQIGEDLYQSQIVRDETPIYFYHQKLKTDDEVRFWKRFAGYSERSRGMQAIYYAILDQENPDCGIHYNEEMYNWMRTQGVEDPEQTLTLAREYLIEHQISPEQLDKLLSGYRGGVAGFNPSVGRYVVFATKNPIDKPYFLQEETNPDPASFSNILMVYNSYETDHGGMEHRGIIRNIHDLIRPDPRYKQLAILSHGFAAEIEHDVYQRSFLEVKPLALMLYLLIKAFPDNYIYGTAEKAFFQNLEQHPDAYPEVLSIALDQMKSQTPINLEELRHKSIEQDRIVLDLEVVAESFRKAETN